MVAKLTSIPIAIAFFKDEVKLQEKAIQEWEIGRDRMDFQFGENIEKAQKEIETLNTIIRKVENDE